jgi:hypothetical protein
MEPTKVTDSTAPEMSPTKKLELELEERRRKANAKLDAAGERERLAELRRTVEFEEVLADLADTHGLPYPAGNNIAAVRALDVMIVVKRVPEGAYKAFQKVAERANEKNPIPDATIERFVREGLLYPSLEEFNRIATEKPAAVLHACSALQTLHGAKLKEAEGKA